MSTNFSISINWTCSVLKTNGNNVFLNEGSFKELLLTKSIT